MDCSGSQRFAGSSAAVPTESVTGDASPTTLGPPEVVSKPAESGSAVTAETLPTEPAPLVTPVVEDLNDWELTVPEAVRAATTRRRPATTYDDEPEDPEVQRAFHEPENKRQRKARDLQDKREYLTHRITVIREYGQRFGSIDESMELEQRELHVSQHNLERHTTDSEDELTQDEFLVTARLNGSRKRKAIRMQHVPAKKRKEMAQYTDDGQPSTLRMEATLDTNDADREYDYRLASYYMIRAAHNPQIELRPVDTYPPDTITAGWLVVNYNQLYNETIMRRHSSKKKGNADIICAIQNCTLAVILEIDLEAKAKPYGKKECGTLRIRTIGEEHPVTGWCSMDYFYVLTHRGEPLYAPQNAQDDFWRSVVRNLTHYDAQVARYYHTQLRENVYLPYPRPPPLEEEGDGEEEEEPPQQDSAAAGSPWDYAHGWQWSCWPEGRSSSSSSSGWWQSNSSWNTSGWNTSDQRDRGWERW